MRPVSARSILSTTLVMAALCITATDQWKFDFVATYETTNGKRVYLLNSAEASRTNRLGTNMFVDAYGDVWINPAKKLLLSPNTRDVLFA
jgi:hypothetical protein